MTDKDNFLEELMLQQPQFFADILRNRSALNIQVIYTQIDRNKKGAASFTDHFFEVNSDRYFYPASTVKFPVAVLALQRLNELKIAGLDKNTTMLTGTDGDGQTGVTTDSTAANGYPSIAHYIKKILLVSDNDAFNRLYEFLGQEYINNTLHKMGYTDVQLIHRLSLALTEEQNRHTNPIRFVDKEGKTLYQQPAANSQLVYAHRDDKAGNGYLKDDQLVTAPFDFSQKNRISLQDLHLVMRSILFPKDVSPTKRFNLTADDYQFLQQYMSMLPSSSDHPKYDSSLFGDTYVKNWMYSKNEKMEPGIRIYNKTGTAYGYLVDIAYIADTINQIEFMLSGVIYCNSDGIFNDDKYEYDSIGYPFFKHLGRAVYEYERQRKRKHVTPLPAFRF